MFAATRATDWTTAAGSQPRGELDPLAGRSMQRRCRAPDPPAPSRLDDDEMERELAELSAHLDAAAHRHIVLIRQIDESGLWARQGAKTCAHWLSWRIQMDLGAARERLRIGHALAKLPVLDEAFRTARLSYSQVRAITRVATPDNEERLLELARRSTASQLERICRRVRKVTRAEGEPGAPDGCIERWVRLRPMGDGTSRVEGQLMADEAARVMDAVRSARARMRQGDAEPTMADALVRLIEEWSAVRPLPAHGAEAARGDAVALGRDADGNRGDTQDIDRHGARRGDDDDEDDGQWTSGDGGGDGAQDVGIHDADAGRAHEAASGGAADEGQGDAGDIDPRGSADANARDADGGDEAPTQRADRQRVPDHPRRPDRQTHPRRPRTGGDLSTLVVQLGPDVLERSHAVTLEDGTRLHPETLRRIACDCGLVPVQTDEEGEPLDVGRKTRAIPPAVRRAITIRDGACCTFPGCTHLLYLHGHHVEHWFDGGETKKDNLLLLCSFHHQLVHEGGWDVRFDGTDRPRFVRPDGGRHPQTFPRKCIDLGQALDAIGDTHRDVDIDEETARSGWDGDRPDLAACVRAALPREVLDAPAAAWLAERGYRIPSQDGLAAEEPSSA